MVAEPKDPDSKVSGEGSKVDWTQIHQLLNLHLRVPVGAIDPCLTAGTSADSLRGALDFSLDFSDLDH